MFFRRLNWNVVGWFRTVSLISYLIIAAGIGAMLWHATHGPEPGFHARYMLRLGLSFSGGTAVDVVFTRPVSQQQLTSALAPLHLNDETIRTVGKPAAGDGYNHFNVETLTSLGNDTPSLWSALNSAAPVNRSLSKVEAVGPTLGKEYLTKAIEALIIALGIQFLYIAFRFGWNYIFGLVTVIALVRDALMMIGIYAIADKRADDAFLAAVLTVIGYSVMDTIVILDRIRENTKLLAGQPYDKIVNTSILQTMTRSFNTLATVVITLVALLALGGGSLKNFAFALLVGICSGGYHSIFYSAPLVLYFRKRQIAQAAKRRAAGLTADRTRSTRSVAESKALGVREDIVAARKARRERERAARTAPPRQQSPARYRRKRNEPPPPPAASSPTTEEIEPLEQPVDEQLGHEEVNLNFEGFELQQPLPAPESETATDQQEPPTQNEP